MFQQFLFATDGCTCIGHWSNVDLYSHIHYQTLRLNYIIRKGSFIKYVKDSKMWRRKKNQRGRIIYFRSTHYALRIWQHMFFSHTDISYSMTRNIVTSRFTILLILMEFSFYLILKLNQLWSKFTAPVVWKVGRFKVLVLSSQCQDGVGHLVTKTK